MSGFRKMSHWLYPSWLVGKVGLRMGVGIWPYKAGQRCRAAWRRHDRIEEYGPGPGTSPARGLSSARAVICP